MKSEEWIEYYMKARNEGRRVKIMCYIKTRNELSEDALRDMCAFWLHETLSVARMQMLHCP
jgi:hypothetical protein